MIQGPPPQFDRITVEECGTEKIITYRWSHSTYLMHFIDVIFASGFIVVIVRGWNHSQLLFDIIAVTVALILGILSLYVALTGVFNATKVSVCDQKIAINSQPILWFRDRRHEIIDIVKVYSTERNARWRLEPPRIYSLRAMKQDESVKTILGHTNSDLEAAYICEKLQQWLGLDSKPFLEVILDKLYEPDQKLNPSFIGTRRYSVAPNDMIDAVQLMIERGKLIHRKTISSSHVTFDTLELRWRSGEHYMLTQVTIKAVSDGSEITVKQKPKPYMYGFGHNLNVRGVFVKIEHAREFLQYQFYEDPPDHRVA